MTEVNFVPARSGKLKAVCRSCGALSRPLPPSRRGEPDVWNVCTGWSVAPHANGSRYTCPACDRRLMRGEKLELRSGGTMRRVA